VETNGPQSSSEAIGQLWEGFAQFGADWWYVAAIAIVGSLAGAFIASRGHTLDVGEDGGARAVRTSRPR
jgi:uncharacterized membrane protein YfcA